MNKWKDPRPPVWQGLVKGKLITIYDMAAYEESKLLYPDDEKFQKLELLQKSTNSAKPFTKQKPAAWWNWIHKLEQPLEGKVS